MARRPQGSGSIYRRSSDGLWVFASVSSGARLTVAHSRFCGLLARMPSRSEQPRRHTSRTAAIQQAREIGTHTDAEWSAYVLAREGICEYCGRPCAGMQTKDHRTPVSRGGSDALTNLAVACPPCNWRKATLTEAEFREWMVANPAECETLRTTPLTRRRRAPRQPDGLYSVDEAARRLSVSGKRIRGLIREGRLESRPAGIEHRITPDSVRSYIAALPSASQVL